MYSTLELNSFMCSRNPKTLLSCSSNCLQRGPEILDNVTTDTDQVTTDTKVSTLFSAVRSHKLNIQTLREDRFLSIIYQYQYLSILYE